jgi:CubicO group peptidase (beta-lactamase class C family)
VGRAFAAAALLVTLAAPSLFAQALPRATKPEEVGLSSERLQRLTDTFQGYVKDGKLAGAVVLVTRRGKVAYSGAFGSRDPDAHSPMKEDAIFRIASQTKALVSVAALQLQEGKAGSSSGIPSGSTFPSSRRRRWPCCAPADTASWTPSARSRSATC